MRIMDSQSTQFLKSSSTKLRNVLVLLLLITISLGCTTGCQAPPSAHRPTEMVIHVPDREAFIDATLTLLRQYDLPPERVDRTRGLILTRPTTSGQWFEFWRVDSQGAYQAFESSLHTMARKVTVNLDPLAPAMAETQPATTTDNRYRLTVRVDKSRYSAPERQITTASGALAIYSEHIPTTEGLRRSESPRAHWIPVGRDALLEAYLLAKLIDATPDIELAEGG
ncbi:MAG: hypothetical protein ABIG44_04565 [Planctomycetota bacterium]